MVPAVDRLELQGSAMLAPTPLLIAQLLVSAFLGILFLQSGLDKVFDWRGNRSYIQGYFEKTPLRTLSLMMLFTITLAEVLSGAVSVIGVGVLLLTGQTLVAFVGACLSGASVLALFLGQRIAKDYAGAAGMVPYFIATVLSVLLLGHGASIAPAG